MASEHGGAPPAHPGVRVRHGVPSVADYLRCRAAAGLATWPPDAVAVALGNTLFAVTVVDQAERVVGFGRVVGDGGVAFQLVDVVVVPDCQGRGLGTSIVDELMGWLRAQPAAGGIVSLLAGPDRAAFYQRWGFTTRPTDAPGMSLRLNSETPQATPHDTE